MKEPELSALFLSLPRNNISSALERSTIWDQGRIPFFLIFIQLRFCYIRDLQIFHAFHNKHQKTGCNFPLFTCTVHRKQENTVTSVNV